MIRNLYGRVRGRLHGGKQIVMAAEDMLVHRLQGVFNRVDDRIPLFVRSYLPEVEIKTTAHIWQVQGFRFQRVERADDVEAAPTDVATEHEDGFWEDLPRGVKVDEDIVEAADPALPKEEEPVRSMINHLRDIIENLDDVEDFDVMEKVDDDMYQLWRELERKMQRHKQSEAKHQLKDMFSI